MVGGKITRHYKDMTGRILDQECNEVGIMIGGTYPEYPLWVYLGAPRPDLEIEWIIADSDPSGTYKKPDFQPCAMICQFCPDEWETFRDLPMVYQDPPYRLYMEER